MARDSDGYNMEMPEETTPQTPSRPSQDPDSTSTHGRFLPGTQFSKRYRIVGLLGRGGMGEVYRADDLELGQTVALKFLPHELTGDEAALTLLRNEVRIARQVAHPNVCRVYDLGEIDGQYFVSMEFVDGEDLASLLRRIGRLPKEKGTDIIRQLAAGVAAAHELGVLHRDLKPANIMVDGRGRVRIMDFGLAGFADELRGRRSQGGTLSYMAPEQLAGKGPTTRSDVYSLGLVMYELLTGRRAYKAKSIDELRELQAAGLPPAPSSLVSDLDPAIERVVMWCLAYDPPERPSSGHAVAGSLPGADPFAAALAAGETPSPEVVAAAGGRGAVSMRIGVLLLLIVVIGIAALAFLSERILLLRVADPKKPPVVLADKAASILDQLGYLEGTPHSAYELFRNPGITRHIAETDSSRDRWKKLAGSRPTAYGLWYRRAREPMVTVDMTETRTSWDDPPLNQEGMLRMRLDQTGRLTSLEIVAPWREANAESADPVDWEQLFDFAEIDPSTLRETRPIARPTLASDERWAWTGTYAHRDSLPFQVEAAALGGRPVYFRVFDTSSRDWLLEQQPDEEATVRSRVLDRITMVLYAILFFIVLLLLPAFFGWRNIRAGRADARSAFRFGLVGAALAFMSGSFLSSYFPDIGATMGQVFVGAALSLFLGTVMGLGYLAAEPYLRRSWPDLLISWTRLTGGRYRDPRVGRDILIGAAAATILRLLMTASAFAPTLFGLPMEAPQYTDAAFLMGGRLAIGWFLSVEFLIIAVVVVLVLLLFLLLLRRKMLAITVALVLMALTMIRPGPADIQSWSDAIGFLTGVAILILGLATLIRFGLLAFVSLFFFLFRMSCPVIFDSSAWYSGISTITVLALIGIAIYAFRIATSGRTLELSDEASASRA
jgi:serine/threonine-protein kinase